MQPPSSSGTLAIRSTCSTDTALQGTDTQCLIPWAGLPAQRGQGCGFAACLRPGAGPSLRSQHLRTHGQELVRVPHPQRTLLCFMWGPRATKHPGVRETWAQAAQH